MDAGDIIYVVITIVVILSSLFRKKKKQTPQATSTNMPDELEYTPMYAEPEPTKKDTLENRWATEGVPTTDGYADIEKARAELKRKEALLNHDKKGKTKVVKKKRKSAKISDHFNAKKAIIYATILERKKY